MKLAQFAEAVMTDMDNERIRLQAEIERLRANQERMHCEACGTVTRDGQCDCTKMDTGTQRLVNYADAMAADARELEAENARLRRDCAELYQVIGSMAEYCPDPDDPAIVKALDNASDAADGGPRRHDDLLPFTLRPAPSEQKASE